MSGRFDLVLSTTSFDHWKDQRAGVTSIDAVQLTPSALDSWWATWVMPSSVIVRCNARSVSDAPGWLLARSSASKDAKQLVLRQDVRAEIKHRSRGP
jgi:hypothetical protein